MASLYPWPVEDVSTLSVRRASGHGLSLLMSSGF